MIIGLLLWPGMLPADDWKLRVDETGIQVYQQHRHPQFRQWHTLGLVRLNVSPAAVMALLRDLSACSQWLYGCLSAQELPGDLLRMVFEGPLWFKDRDVVFRTEWVYLPVTRQWLIQVINQADQHPSKNRRVERLHSFSASWLLTEVSAEVTHVSYELYMDPGLAVRAGVNRYNRDAVYLTIAAMRELLKDSTYQQAGELPWEDHQSVRSDRD